MISITKYLFEQNYVPVSQAYSNARANSIAALHAKMAAKGNISLAANKIETPPPSTNITTPPVQSVVQPVNKIVKSVVIPQSVEAPHAVDVGTWGNITKKAAQTITEK